VNNRQAKIKLSTDYSVALNYKFPSLLFKDIANTSIGARIYNLNGKGSSITVDSGLSV
jgi:hypothetical protein